MNIVWFKRDLRLQDHAPIFHASKIKNVLLLYVFEPELWDQDDMSARHFSFLKQAVFDLKNSLSLSNNKLCIKVGNVLEVFDELNKSQKIEKIFSHQETGNGWSFSRDIKVKEWTKKNNVEWIEYPQNGVVRALKSRDGWSKKWNTFMTSSIFSFPKNANFIYMPSDYKKLNLIEKKFNNSLPNRLLASRNEGLELLNRFLNLTGENYQKEMSSPITADICCSKLSAYISFGLLSIREIFQETERRKLKLDYKGSWKNSINSFSKRLRWHCHFMQKLEDDPKIEFENFHSLYNGLRENEFNNLFFEAWKNGETGYPMVDACMRFLIANGWINFRMRAMLVSFASYHLWLDWRKTGIYLANLFLDYEPGIHYSQMQMQSGTTGINTIRIYNPIKQGIDNDKMGIFVRKWIPELSEVPSSVIHTPWKYNIKKINYPDPIVNEKLARENALRRIYMIKKEKGHKAQSDFIFMKHGSRRKKNNIRKKSKVSITVHQQPIEQREFDI